jgi:hypothetical protein
MNTIPTQERLKELGFVTAASEMQRHKEAAPKELRQKLRTAFEHYRVVEPHHIERHNIMLKSLTRKVARKWRQYGEVHKEWSYLQLDFTTIHQYPAAPPAEVLVELEKAKAMGCFDRFEICTLGRHSQIESRPVFRLPDPILFGRIDGSENRYFIAQWDDDIKIEDILKEDEG